MALGLGISSQTLPTTLLLWAEAPEEPLTLRRFSEIQGLKLLHIWWALVQGICKSSLVHFYCALVYFCSKSVFQVSSALTLPLVLPEASFTPNSERTAIHFITRLVQVLVTGKELDLQTLSQVGSL